MAKKNATKLTLKPSPLTSAPSPRRCEEVGRAMLAVGDRCQAAAFDVGRRGAWLATNGGLRRCDLGRSTRPVIEPPTKATFKTQRLTDVAFAESRVFALGKDRVLAADVAQSPKVSPLKPVVSKLRMLQAVGANERFLVTMGWQGFTVHSSPQAGPAWPPKLLTAANDVGSNLRGAVLRDGVLYTTQQKAGLRAFDVAAPGAPEVASVTASTDGGVFCATALWASGDLMWLSGWTGRAGAKGQRSFTWFFDVSEPRAPKSLALFEVVAGPAVMTEPGQVLMFSTEAVHSFVITGDQVRHDGSAPWPADSGEVVATHWADGRVFAATRRGVVVAELADVVVMPTFNPVPNAPRARPRWSPSQLKAKLATAPYEVFSQVAATPEPTDELRRFALRAVDLIIGDLEEHDDENRSDYGGYGAAYFRQQRDALKRAT